MRRVTGRDAGAGRALAQPDMLQITRLGKSLMLDCTGPKRGIAQGQKLLPADIRADVQQQVQILCAALAALDALQDV